MYRGFNLEINSNQLKLDSYYDYGLRILENDKMSVRKTLDDLILPNGRLDGSKMQENWFPQVEADIFISHSHQDEWTAIALAGWLFDKLKVKVFIDSCIWGYSNELLKQIDNKFCLQDDGYYNYSKRNYSTSHVHMMLSTSLNMMIDNTECLFFLNTPNSITTESTINLTLSPWIYSEITMSKLVRKRELSEHRKEKTGFLKKSHDLVFNESIQYNLDLLHLTDLSEMDIDNWVKAYMNEKYALDILYEQQFQLD
jgi:hypothetical protein